MEKYKDRIRRLLDKGYGIFIGLIIANPPTIDEPRVGRIYFLLALCFMDVYLNSKNKRRRNINMVVTILLAIAITFLNIYVKHHVG